MNTIKHTINQGEIWQKVFSTDSPIEITKIQITNPTRKTQKVSLAISKNEPTDVSIASNTIQNVEFISRLAGELGNLISIEFINPGAISDLSVTVTDKKITVTLANNGTAITSTLGDIVTAIRDNSEANALVYIPDTDATTLSATATAQPETFLIGGVTDSSTYILKDYSISSHDYLEIDSNLIIRDTDTNLFAKSNLPSACFLISFKFI